MPEGGYGRRIVFLGAGSVQFAPSLIVDFIRQPDLHGATLCMVDIDADRLALTHALALRLVAISGAPYVVEATTERAEVLGGADAVIISVELDRFPTWEVDRRVPAELGIAQALGENGGPGGLFHAMRQIPPIVDICRDIDRLCPDALVINLSNPMSRICRAIAMNARCRCIGLCHEIKGGNRFVSRVLGVPEADLTSAAAGINHFTWYLSVRARADGADLYPQLRTAARDHVTPGRLLVSDLLRLTGWQCVTNDSHAGEYLAGGHEWRSAWAPDMAAHAFYEWYRDYIAERQAAIMTIVEGSRPTESLLDEASGEDVVGMISDALFRRHAIYDAVNVPNDGLVGNLPRECIVEVPGEAADGHVRGRPVGDLPSPIAEWCRRQVVLHDLTVRAAMDGDRRAALDALLLDPVVPDARTAERVLDAMLDAHRAYLPRFHR